jgi:hypothetical protein
MKKFILAFALFAAFAVGFSIDAHAQNLTTVSASNITDINGTKLAAGQLCFLITDQQDNPISVEIGGGGQALKRGYCAPVAAGAVTPPFTVPNPASTLPSGIYYRVTVRDSSTGQEVLRYTGVSFTGATFNFDNYAPVNLGSFAPLSGNSVSGNLAVSGNIAATGTVTGSNVPSNILQQIFNAGVGLTQRTAFNCLAGIVCSDNTGASRTDVRLGSLTTVAFSATPTFDASTAASFKLTLTGNVTSSTLSNAVAGEPISFELCQDATGGRTFVPPANVLNMGTIVSTANACSTQEFWFDGSNAVSSGPMQSSGGSIIPGTLSVTGTSTLGNVNLGAGNLLGVSSIRQVSPTIAFNISDNLGASHFFISNSSPYLNTFVQGNGTGSVFLGAADKAFVADTTGTITTAGGIALQTTTQTLPASITNDTAGGILFTNNAGSSMQLGNGGTLFLNSPQGIRWTGATSGNTVVQASAVAGTGILTLPATVTDTLVARTTTDTLTNKTLTSPAISDPTITGNTNVKRIKANQGSALVAGDVGGLTAAWGSTASVSSVVGNDVVGQISILSNGTGQNINAGFTLTFHDGTWTTPPVCLAVRGDGFSPQGIMIANAATATNVSFFFNAVPVAGTTYTLSFICVGK